MKSTFIHIFITEFACQVPLLHLLAIKYFMNFFWTVLRFCCASISVVTFVRSVNSLPSYLLICLVILFRILCYLRSFCKKCSTFTFGTFTDFDILNITVMMMRVMTMMMMMTTTTVAVEMTMSWFSILGQDLAFTPQGKFE